MRQAIVYDMGSTAGHVGDIVAELERARLPFYLRYRPGEYAEFGAPQSHYAALLSIIRRALGW
jgi:hypothetical protein